MVKHIVICLLASSRPASTNQPGPVMNSSSFYLEIMTTFKNNCIK